MKLTFTFVGLMMLSLLSACNTSIVSTVTPGPATLAPPQPSPTSPPVTQPTVPPPITRLAILTSDNQVEFADLLGSVTHLNFPGGVLPRGGSRLVWSGERGGFYTVIGWLNDEALLLHWTGGLNFSVWLVNVNSAEGHRVAEGVFLALVR